MHNRLISETSPYLLQHAHNPVDWYPWCDKAFEKSRTHNLPIFLSIGYSACHWCHVMEREVFENSEIAEFLNQHMVCIKVDREERPDIDRHFQEVFQVINRRAGGWPLSIFLTPSLKPVYAATYIPPISNGGMTGFLDLVRIIDNAWRNTPDKLEAGGSQVLEYLEAVQAEQAGKSAQVPDDIAKRFLDQAVSLYDPEYGGFSPAPKFPSPSIINLLMDISLMRGSRRAGDMALHTLKRMAEGGLHDLVDGGFCRYSVDEKWLIPHFEKMTYDNALLCESYFRAWQMTGRQSFLVTAERTAGFMLERMHENGLFYSASDADSEGEEGRYFVYSYQEVIDALVEQGGFAMEQASEAADALSITKTGNFDGANIVRLRGTERPTWYEQAIVILRKIRDQRAYPFIDRKVITSWNAMMIKSLFLLDGADSRFIEQAHISLSRLTEKMFRHGTLYHSSLPETEPAIKAFLEDYAFLTDALLTAYQATLDPTLLDTARLLAEQAVELFYEQGSWYFSRGDFPTSAETMDSAYPSSSAVMVSAIITLASIEGGGRWYEVASESISMAAGNIASFPLSHGMFVRNVLRMQAGDIIVHANPDALMNIRPALQDTGYPFILLSPEAHEGFTICKGTSCLARANTADEAADRIKELAS